MRILTIFKKSIIKAIILSMLIIILFPDCTFKNNRKNNIVGSYKSIKYSKYNFFDNYPSDIQKYSRDNELEILDNGKFKYNTCANIIEGLWFFQGDTLKLICNSVKIKSPNSINESIEYHNPIYFLVNQNDLYWIDFNNKKEKRITIMRRHK